MNGVTTATLIVAAVTGAVGSCHFLPGRPEPPGARSVDTPAPGRPDTR